MHGYHSMAEGVQDHALVLRQDSARSTALGMALTALIVPANVEVVTVLVSKEILG